MRDLHGGKKPAGPVALPDVCVILFSSTIGGATGGHSGTVYRSDGDARFRERPDTLSVDTLGLAGLEDRRPDQLFALSQ